MSFFRVLVSLLGVLAATQECQNCEADELELLQAKTEEKFPDWSEVLGAGKDAMTSGVGQVTSKMGDAISELNSEVMQAEGMFNTSLDKFNQAADATATVSQNMTKFQTLIRQTVQKYAPFYVTAVEEVNQAVKTTKAVAAMLGQKELKEKLEAMNASATEKLRKLADTSEALAAKVVGTSSDKYGEILDDVREKLGTIASTAASFRKKLNKNVESLSDALQGPMEVALGDSANDEIMKFKTQVQATLLNMEKFTAIVKTGLSKAADGVDTQLAEVKKRKKGFFSRVFGGLFR
mmetsp:Transcript_18331/g.31031  ORF Transcript_18331/g.31031 Transcript_18331/m.31031 type:complete len:293 (+) Transcript_18331:82-960(+)